MMIDAKDELFMKATAFGIPGIFTCLRVDRTTVPKGLYAYDVRHDDLCTGEAVEIRPKLMVNHWGTIITKEPIPMTDGGTRYVINEDDFYYGGESTTLEEFMDDSDARIEHDGDRVYYIDENGKAYIIYILVDFGAKIVDHSKPYHYMAVAVEYVDGGAPCGHFYISGADDEELLACCKEHVHAI